MTAPRATEDTTAFEIAYDDSWAALETSYGGGGYRIDREKLSALIADAIAAARRGAAMTEQATIDQAVQAERDRIASWLDCARDCQHIAASGACHRTDDFCGRYVADCIRRGAKP